MSIPKIRLAFQGGGAKLAAMLPVADAFRTCHVEQDIVIEKISGTSAGAICAALVATSADFDEVRELLTTRGPSYFSKLIPIRIGKLKRKIDRGQNLGMIDILCQPALMRDVLLRGAPVLNADELHRFVSDLLNIKSIRGIRDFNDAGAIDLAITTSDIVNSKGVTLTKEGDLVQAVVDSCALPILLRSFGTLRETHHVDGGLCDNLPVASLVGDHHDPIFAVYPETTNKRLNISNIFSYFSSLLSASISHSTLRSVSMVSQPFRFEVETDLALLDFDRAIEQLKDDNWYQAKKAQAIRKIRDFSVSYGFALAPQESRVIDIVEIDQYQKSLSRLTDDYKFMLRQVGAKFIVRINCDEKSNKKNAPNRQADTITRVSQFLALNDDVRYYRTSIKTHSDNVVPTIWSSRNTTTGEEIPIRALPLEDMKVGKVKVRDCLIEFVDTGSRISKGDIIEIQSVYHSAPGQDMENINKGIPESFGFINVTGCSLEAELQLIYPKRLGKIRLAVDEEQSEILVNKTKNLKFGREDYTYIGPFNDIVGLSVAELPDGGSFMAQAFPT